MRPPMSTRTIAVRAPQSPSSIGHLTGLQTTQDALDLKSSVALVIDQENGADKMTDAEIDALFVVAKK